jgi:hypothetical protein
MLRVLFYGLPALIFVVGLPLALQWVGPNRLYGFRTATTFSSLNAWYQINFATGVALIVSGILSGVVVVLLDHGVIALKPEARYLAGILLTGIFFLASLIPVVVYSDGF